MAPLKAPLGFYRSATESNLPKAVISLKLRWCPYLVKASFGPTMQALALDMHSNFI